MALLSKKNEDLTVTRKMPDGTTMTVKSPNGSSMDMLGLMGGMVEGSSPTPVADNVPAMLTAGEFVVNVPAANKYKGLLKQINQEGRRALAMGGWTDKPKPIHMRAGGIVPEQFGGYSPENFQQNAPLTNPAPVPSQPIQLAPVNQPPVVSSQPVGLPTNTQPDVAPAIETAVNEVKKAGGTADEARDTAMLTQAAGTGGIKSMIAELDTQIEAQGDKRQKAKKLAFGLALLGGESMGTALQLANQTPFFNETQLDNLLQEKEALLERAGLSGKGSSMGDQPFRGSDGRIYFQQGNRWVDADGNTKPQGVDLMGKASTLDEGDLPTRLQGAVNSADEEIAQARSTQAKIKNLGVYADKGWSGIFGKGTKTIKDLVGSQDEASVYRSQLEGLLNSIALADLPPGAASDKDVELVRRGVIDGFANEGAVDEFLAAIDRLANYQVRYNEAKREHIYDNRGTKGFKAPTYDANIDASANVGITSQSGNVDVDLDLSDI